MNKEQQLIRDQQKTVWDAASAGWRKYDEFNMNFLRFAGDAIIRGLELKPTDHVLDVAAGSGEPGLTIAGIVTEGSVISSDLSGEMLAIGREKAAQRNIKNFTTQVCDACELPYADATFDAISCRFGFMFFPDVLLASREMARVLKPGGKIAASVWGSPKENRWVTAMSEAMAKHLEVPTPSPTGPGMFRLSDEGALATIFATAGLKPISDIAIGGKNVYGSKEFFWSHLTDNVGPIRQIFSEADEPTRLKIKDDLFALLDSLNVGADCALSYEARIIVAEKP